MVQLLDYFQLTKKLLAISNKQEEVKKKFKQSVSTLKQLASSKNMIKILIFTIQVYLNLTFQQFNHVYLVQKDPKIMSDLTNFRQIGMHLLPMQLDLKVLESIKPNYKIVPTSPSTENNII